MTARIKIGWSLFCLGLIGIVVCIVALGIGYRWFSWVIAATWICIVVNLIGFWLILRK